MLLNPDAPAVLLVEEPENGLNPRMFLEILDLFLSSRGLQVFLTTHSPYFLDKIKEPLLDGEAEVFLFKKEDGITKIKALSELAQEKGIVLREFFDRERLSYFLFEKDDEKKRAIIEFAKQKGIDLKERSSLPLGEMWFIGYFEDF